MCRFGVFQDGKWRCCDDAASSGHNLATSLVETIQCIDADFPAALAAAFLALGVVALKLCGDDINGAYRKVGNSEPWYTVFIVWNPTPGSEGHRYFKVPGFNFGLKSAVTGFNRVTRRLRVSDHIDHGCGVQTHFTRRRASGVSVSRRCDVLCVNSKKVASNPPTVVLWAAG